MKPAPFGLMTPTTTDEALAMLAEHDGEARPLAGGQSLVPMMNFRLARPSVLIDLNRIADLAGVQDGGAYLSIGAMTRWSALENNPDVAASAPLIAAALLNVAHRPIRNRGTIGGSLCHADPAAEMPAVMLALDATLLARSADGEREIPASAFFDGVLSTALEPNELLVEIRVPKPAAGTGAAFQELSRRKGDFALAGVAAQVTQTGDTVADVRLAACGVGDGPVRLSNAEEAYRSGGADAAAQAAAEEVDPESDIHADAAYRRKLAAAMTRRALVAAAAQAGSSS